MKQLLKEDQRFLILKSLLDLNSYCANEAILQSCLKAYGHHLSQDRLRAELAWLEMQGLLTLENLRDLWIATLTLAGSEVAQGLARMPGIRPPKPHKD